VRTLSGLAMRHRQLAAEMSLRGYVDRTPIRVTMSRAKWPGVLVTEPADQRSQRPARRVRERDPTCVPVRSPDVRHSVCREESER
jgi:hypothetical protein